MPFAFRCHLPSCHSSPASPQEDESGRLRPLAVTQQQREQRRQQMGLGLGLGHGGSSVPVTARIRRGIIRYLVLALDFSKVSTGAV